MAKFPINDSSFESIEGQPPKVSILLPNLNNYRYLPERFDSIFGQTFEDWELIVVDSYSDDGAWELIQNYAKDEPRMRISQTPRRGIYAGINDCIGLARGEYIYIATSDDTMLPQCLEQMVFVLEKYNECDICHTPLIVINEHGNEVPDWWLQTPPAKYYGDWVNFPHIRYAPYDGILHSALHTVYISITQLLIRRSLFKKIGLFSSKWGSMGDFEWSMRAALVSNVFHLPEKLATWRIHIDQATQHKRDFEYMDKICEMVVSSVQALKAHNPELWKKIEIQKIQRYYRQEQLSLKWNSCISYRQKLLAVLEFFSVDSVIALHVFKQHILRRPALTSNIFLHKEIARLGINSSDHLQKKSLDWLLDNDV